MQPQHYPPQQFSPVQQQQQQQQFFPQQQQYPQQQQQYGARPMMMHQQSMGPGQAYSPPMAMQQQYSPQPQQQYSPQPYGSSPPGMAMGPAPVQQQMATPNGAVTMGLQSGMAAPAPGFSSHLQQQQYNEQMARQGAEAEVRTAVIALSNMAEQMMTTMRSAPSTMFAPASGPADNPSCWDWCAIKCCGGCGSAYNDPRPGTGLQRTIANLTMMEGNTRKMISSLNMGTKHLTADPIFSAQLASTFGRVVELIELMRRYRAVFVSNCCACFGCCMTNGFGGEPAVEEIAEKLEKLVTQVKANFKLDIQIGGVNRVTGETGHDVELDNRSSVKITEVDQTRVVMTNQGQSVAMMDVANNGGKTI